MADSTGPKAAEPGIAAGNAAVRDRLPFDDTQDFEDAGRGLIGTAGEHLVRGADGGTVWDLDAYGFLDADCPDTAHPSLWRQSRLVARHGLYEVVEGIYQVRGFDLSNMTIVEGDRGVLVIDPLISAETAAAALALYRRHRGERPVTAVLYTHSHVDHFGGVRGVVTDEDVAGGVPVIAPHGFLAHAVSENVYAGTAMGRRAAYMYGAALPKGGRGQIGAGLGQTTSTGAVGLLPPTLDVTATGQTETVDGIRMVFHLTPGTEAPAELNIHFPGHRALCMAENATHNLHNLLTLRGAQVRNPHVWAHYLTEAIALYAGSADVAFASHHWPVWGRERVLAYLSEQRDLYAYLHDQTLRMLNQGMTPLEIAETIQMPPALEGAWHTHGYYGSVSHNVKAVYQHYLGWFDGNPAHLWEHPPAEAAQRYVELREGSVGTPTVTSSQDFLQALTLDQLFDSLAIRVDGPRCWDADLTIRFGLRDAEPVTARLRRGVLVHTTGATPEAAGPDLEIDLAEADLRALLLGAVRLDELTGQGRAEIRGDAGRLAELLGYLGAPDPDFAVVTP